MEYIWIALAAFGGGIIAALIGWGDTGGPFNISKFRSSLLRAVIAAVLFAVGYGFSGSGVSMLDIFYAILGGAGVDVAGNRIAGVIANRWRS